MYLVRGMVMLVVKGDVLCSYYQNHCDKAIIGLLKLRLKEESSR